MLDDAWMPAQSAVEYTSGCPDFCRRPSPPLHAETPGTNAAKQVHTSSVSTQPSPNSASDFSSSSEQRPNTTLQRPDRPYDDF